MGYKRIFVFLFISFLALVSALSIKNFIHKNEPDSTPSVLLVNDTSLHYHWGCFLKSAVIKENLETYGYHVDSLQTSLLYRIKAAPNIAENYNNTSILSNFSKENPQLIEKIKNSKFVVINAEGTLHGMSNQVTSIFYIAYISKVFFGKPVHIINASLFPNDFFLTQNSEEKKFYDFVLEKVDSIAFRDSYSYNLFSNFHKKAVLAFDLIPLYIKKHFAQETIKSTEKRVVISGSANLFFLQSRLEDFYNYIVYLHQKGYSITFLVGGLSKGAYDDQKIIDFFLEKSPLSGFSVITASSPEEWLTTIKKASFVVIGRQSICIAAHSLKVPYICFNSNTPKIEAFFNELNNEQPVISLEDPHFLEKLIHTTENLEKNPPQFADSEGMRLLIERAKKNFSFLSNPN